MTLVNSLLSRLESGSCIIPPSQNPQEAYLFKKYDSVNYPKAFEILAKEENENIQKLSELYRQWNVQLNCAELTIDFIVPIHVNYAQRKLQNFNGKSLFTIITMRRHYSQVHFRTGQWDMKAKIPSNEFQLIYSGVENSITEKGGSEKPTANENSNSKNHQHPNAFIVLGILNNASKCFKKLVELNRNLHFILCQQRVLQNNDSLQIQDIVFYTGLAGVVETSNLQGYIEQYSKQLNYLSALYDSSRVIYVKEKIKEDIYSMIDYLGIHHYNQPPPKLTPNNGPSLFSPVKTTAPSLFPTPVASTSTSKGATVTASRFSATPSSANKIVPCSQDNNSNNQVTMLSSPLPGSSSKEAEEERQMRMQYLKKMLEITEYDLKIKKNQLEAEEIKLSKLKSPKTG